MNYEAIDDMINDLKEIDRKLGLLRHLQIVYPKCWNLMLSVNAGIAKLKRDRAEINQMLEDEYEQLDIVEVLVALY